MLSFLENQSPVLLAFFATLFTYGVTILGASVVFLFKKIDKGIMDAMLSFAAGIMVAASFFSLLEPSIEMAEKLNMTPWVISTIGVMCGGILLFVGDKVFSNFNKRLDKNSDNEKNNSLKRCIMLVLSITLHNIPEGIYKLLHIIIIFNFYYFSNNSL